MTTDNPAYRDWEQLMVAAENLLVWLLAPWLAVWRIWRNR